MDINMKRFQLWAVAAILAPGFLPVCVAQTKIEPRYNLFTQKQDIDLGREAAKEYEKKLPLMSDKAVTSYVEELGRRLVAKSRGPPACLILSVRSTAPSAG